MKRLFTLIIFIGTLGAQQTAPPTPIESWRQTHFGTLENSRQSADTADPDQDGLDNLLEYAIGSDPNQANDQALLTPDPKSPSFSFTFQKASSATDINFMIQESPDLESWTPALGNQTLLLNNGRTQRLQFSRPTGSDHRLYFRTKVIRPLILEPFWMEEIYGSSDTTASLETLASHPTYQDILTRQKITLLGGPTLGQLTPTTATVWFRTARPASVTVSVGNKTFGPTLTSFETDLTGTISLTGLRPFAQHQYQIFVDGQIASPLPSELTFTTPPPAGARQKFSVAFGACSRFVPELEGIWEVIAQQNPLAYLTLGDNLYIDRPENQNMQRVHYYRRQFHPSYRVMTASTGIYSIWDDHDFGNNDQAGGAGIIQTWKLHNFNVFAENWNNPSYPGGGAYPGCFYDFTLGDVHFIMTDGRFYREKGQTMLGPEQQNWLLQTLASSKSTFKVLCSGTLWTEHADNGLDSWAGHRQDRDEIFALIRDAKIPGVFLLSGDRHRHEMFQINFDVGYPLYEFETAKVTGYHSHPSNPFALFSYTKGNFFGMLDFDFSVQDPTVTYRCVTESGKSPQHLTFQTSLAKLTPAR